MALPKPLVWLRGEIKTPPFSHAARLEAGFLLRRLQDGELIGMPSSRPLPEIGANCHELRVVDRDVTWRVVFTSRTMRSSSSTCSARKRGRCRAELRPLRNGD